MRNLFTSPYIGLTYADLSSNVVNWPLIGSVLPPSVDIKLEGCLMHKVHNKAV